MTTDYDISKDILASIREASLYSKGRNVIKEEEEKGNDAIAITNDAKFGSNVLQNQIDAFKQAVNPGAKFGRPNEDEPKNNPLIYFPNTGNLVFSGSIPSLQGLKFQFSLNESTAAPFIFVDGVALTEEFMTTLKKLVGYYKNWRTEWLSETDLLDKLGNNV